MDQAASPGALDRIAALVDADPEFERLAPHVAASVLELVGADGVWVVVRRRDEADIVLRHWVGVQPRQHAALDLPIAADPLIERAVLASGPLALARYVEDAVRDPFLVEQRVATVAAAALRAGVRDEGVPDRVSPRRHGAPFDAVEADRLAAAARTLALVLTTHAARREHARALARERLVDARRRGDRRGGRRRGGARAHRRGRGRDRRHRPRARARLRAGRAPSIVAATPGRPLEVLEAAAFGPLATRTLTPLADVLQPGSLTRPRPILVIDTLAFLTRLGVHAGCPPACAPCAAAPRRSLPLVDGDDAVGALLRAARAPAARSRHLRARSRPSPRRPPACCAATSCSREIEHAYLATVTALANALEAKDLSTHEHATRDVAPGRRTSAASSASTAPSSATSSSRPCCTTSARSRSRTRS